MENAADALKMAASVLIFVLALSISINAFGEARIVSQTVLEYSDREYDYTYIDANGGTKRIVGIESVIPSIYKAYRENYKIVFTNLPDGVFKRKDKDGNWQTENSIDLQKETLGTETQKEQFIMAILYGSKCKTTNDAGFDFYQLQKDFESNSKISLYSTGLYDKINGSTLEEETGIFYQEEAGENPDDTTNGTSVPEANMTTKRVIRYTIL